MDAAAHSQGPPGSAQAGSGTWRLCEPHAGWALLSPRPGTQGPGCSRPSALALQFDRKLDWSSPYVVPGWVEVGLSSGYVSPLRLLLGSQFLASVVLDDHSRLTLGLSPGPMHS